MAILYCQSDMVPIPILDGNNNRNERKGRSTDEQKKIFEMYILKGAIFSTSSRSIVKSLFSIPSLVFMKEAVCFLKPENGDDDDEE